MSVVSYIFIVFLAFTVLIYYIVPKKIQWWVLLAASVVFYAYSGIDDLLIVVGTAFLVYPLTMLMEKNLEEQDRLLLDADKRAASKIFMCGFHIFITSVKSSNHGCQCTK